MISREYRSWSFTDRSFLFAAAVSVLWHLFWFFSVTITVGPDPQKPRAETRVVSLGPVLDDTILRTLVEGRREFSKAFYRELSDFDAATELPTQTVERHESGDVTSLPFGGDSERSLRRLMSGDKPSAQELLGGGFSGQDYFTFEGEISTDRVLSRPPVPAVNDVRPVEIEFEIDSSGGVARMEVVDSSGDPSLDRRWEDHLRQWLFLPSPVLGEQGRLRGRVKFRQSMVSKKDV